MIGLALLGACVIYGFVVADRQADPFWRDLWRSAASSVGIVGLIVLVVVS